ncbi:MAG: hypothetical protein D6732_06680 [Methanobacteriota archaeon]|nr:MAG: hypothetical protein D6732_06680 [Euryarchaeota archaeon]
MAWDASFKNFLKTYLHANIVTELDVPSANLRLDFMIENNGSLPSPFCYANAIILGEFKSERDRFDMKEFYGGLAKAYLHLSTIGHEREPELSLMFILGGGIRIPTFLVSNTERMAPGIYLVQDKLHVLVVELDHLEYDNANQFLRLFASKPIRRPVIANALRNKETFITSYSYFLYKDEVMEVAEAENIDIDPRSLSIRAAVESIGFDRVLEEMGIERAIEVIGIDRIIEKVGIERVIDQIGIERVIDQIGIERVIDQIGIERVINQIGINRVIENISFSQLIELLGIEKLHAELTAEQKEQLKRLLDRE